MASFSPIQPVPISSAFVPPASLAGAVQPVGADAPVSDPAVVQQSQQGAKELDAGIQAFAAKTQALDAVIGSAAEQARAAVSALGTAATPLALMVIATRMSIISTLLDIAPPTVLQQGKGAATSPESVQDSAPVSDSSLAGTVVPTVDGSGGATAASPIVTSSQVAPADAVAALLQENAQVGDAIKLLQAEGAALAAKISPATASEQALSLFGAAIHHVQKAAFAVMAANYAQAQLSQAAAGQTAPAGEAPQATDPGSS